MSSPSTSSDVSLNKHTVSALSELCEVSPLYQPGCYSLLLKVLDAVLAHPSEPKYRRLNVHKLRPKLRTNAALKLLESIGFVPVDAEADAEEFMQMNDAPTQEQMDVMRHVRAKLQEMSAAVAASSATAAASSSQATAAAKSPVVLAHRQLLPQEGDTVEDSKFVLFWHPPSWGGQWTSVDFVVDGVTYTCAEQYMMASKARLFGDHTVFARIMTSASPREHKKLGRQVSGFQQDVWEKHCLAIVTEGNYAKFSQHVAFKQRLLATRDKTIAEASPLDGLWGTGLAATDPRIRNPAQWPGQNLLGRALMDVRERLRKEDAAQKEKELAHAAKKAAEKR